MRFPYKKSTGMEISPSIPVKLAGQRTHEFIALIDSGADISIIPKKLADYLGLAYEDSHTRLRGIGGFVETATSTVDIAIQTEKSSHQCTIP